MSINPNEYIVELNQNYNDLGEDLLMLEAILLALDKETGFPGEYIASSLKRIQDYTRQHIQEIDLLSNSLIHTADTASPYFPRMAQK